MEGNGLSGGLFSGLGSGMLGLELPVHPPQQQQHQQNLQNPPPQFHTQTPKMVPFSISHHESDQDPQNQHSVSYKYPSYSNPKQQHQSQLALSDEDEHAVDDGDGKKKESPWQRMKWTDSMVRLLIMAVFYIGDDQVGSDEAANASALKKKCGGGMLQKKGKWKSVSKAMMEKGFYVSPQQCEDKFNDLNKRYKRVNDILGKGIACRVVENHNLLDSMDNNLSKKLKEEVRKLLNSKHLFFREMCAYHNSCAGGSHQSPEMHHPPLRKQRSHDFSDNASLGGPNSSKTETEEGSKMAKWRMGEDDDHDYDDEDDDHENEEDDDDDADEENVIELSVNGHHHPCNNQENERSSRKKQRSSNNPELESPLIQQLRDELMNLETDRSKNPWEKKQWMKTQLMKLEEEKVKNQCEALELEKQRLKWAKFSSKKEREMEKEKLKNERRKLENERMVLLLHQKELELIERLRHHQ